MVVTAAVAKDAWSQLDVFEPLNWEEPTSPVEGHPGFGSSPVEMVAWSIGVTTKGFATLGKLGDYASSEGELRTGSRNESDSQMSYLGTMEGSKIWRCLQGLKALIA